MTISRGPQQTESYMKKILSGGIDNPVLIDKYMPGFFDEPAPYQAHIYGIIMDRVMHAIKSDPIYNMLY
jgi:hypothetical protein